MFQLSKRDYFTVRNEWWRDERGRAVGLPRPTTPATQSGSAISSTIVMMIRPEIGFYHSYDVPAFDLGKKKNLLMYGFDLTIRF